MENSKNPQDLAPPPAKGLREATFGAGCFWCLEAVLRELEGVKYTLPGYAGGSVDNPSYKEVCTGTTGHAEVVRLHYDPSTIPFKGLLKVFWRVHDPTQMDRQGADIGPQYRSVIFYHDEEQREEAEHYKKELDRAGAWQAPIVTELSPCQNFYPAEEAHRNYFEKNPEAGYCRAVIAPKLEKFRDAFHKELNSENREESPPSY